MDCIDVALATPTVRQPCAASPVVHACSFYTSMALRYSTVLVQYRSQGVCVGSGRAVDVLHGRTCVVAVIALNILLSPRTWSHILLPRDSAGREAWCQDELHCNRSAKPKAPADRVYR